MANTVDLYSVYLINMGFVIMYTTYQKDPTHKHTHTHTTCLPSDKLIFQHALPISTSANISRHSVLHLDGMEVCSLRIRKRGWLYCRDLCYGHPTFMAEGHNHYCGLVHGLHVEKNNSTSKPDCLTIVNFLKYTHNLQMWPLAANMTWWVACWRPMSYVNSFTDSTVASNIHLLIFTQPTQEHANA